VNEYPWIAKVVAGGGLCGGSLIATKWVVTAAHCIQGDTGVVTEAASIIVTLGEHDTVSTTETSITKDFSVTKVIAHENYVYDSTASEGLKNDIALLELKTAADLSVYTPVCLPTAGTDYTGKKAWVYGWGTTASQGSLATKLLEVELTVVSDATCKTSLAVGNFYQMTDAAAAVMVCAGGVVNKDACQGDSGGPLSYDSSGQHQLIGVVSFGDGCGQADKHGVYAEVAALRTWIDGKISGATTCTS